MELVEIIKGEKTSPETLARAYDYVLQIGKTPIVVNDSRGFFTSRTFGTFVQEGAAMLAEGIPAAAIENAARQAGMPVGPLEVIDQTSMSLSVHVMEQTIADLEGRGQAAAAGASRAEGDREDGEGAQPPGPRGGRRLLRLPEGRQEDALAGAGEASSASPDVKWDLQEMKDRILYRQAIETARCLEEGVLMTRARRQHRLHLRHRLSRLDRRRRAVRQFASA